MLRAARVARGSHPATPASARPAPLRFPSPTARPPAVLRAAPPSLGPLSVASAGRNGAHWPHLLGARNTSTHPCALLGDALSRSHRPCVSLPIAVPNALRRRFTTVADTKAQQITGERRFCSNGPIDPAEQMRIYYVSPHEWNKKHLLDSVQDAAYVVLRGARQCGKTTRMTAFRTQLDAAGYISCFLDLQPVADAKSSIAMWKLISEGLQPAPGQRFADGADFAAWLKSLSHRSGKKDIVLILDEGDSLANLPDDLRTEFLSVLRSQKTSRVMSQDKMSGSPVKAAYLIGVITASSLKTKKNVSPFNISQPLEAPFFTEAEVQELFDQFAADQSKRDPAFVLDTAIGRHVFHLTNGHQGLVNMCGMRLHQLTSRLGRAPTADEWSDEMECKPLRDEFLGSTTGRRLFESLTEDPECNLVARYLLDPPASSLPASLPSDKRFDAAEYMLVAGLLRRPDAATYAVEWASPELPVRGGCLDVAELIEHALPFMLRSLVCDPKAMKQKNNADHSKEAVQGVFESRYAAELRRVLTALLGGRSGARVLSEEPLQPGSPRRLDIVVNYNTQPPIVIEVGANLNLTGQGEKDKSTLHHHIVKQAVPYLQQLGGKEAWVVNFTTVPPTKYEGGAYPFGQRAANVHVMHVFHDPYWTRAEIFTSNGYNRVVDLLERPTAAARPLLPPFELESFLRNVAEIDEDGVKEYVPLLRKNKVDEKGLRVLATEPKRDIEARLEKWGISVDGDRLKLANAIVTRFGGGGSRK